MTLRSRFANRLRRFFRIDDLQDDLSEVHREIRNTQEHIKGFNVDVMASLDLMAEEIHRLRDDLELIMSVYNVASNSEPPTPSDTKRGDPHVG